MQAKRGIRSFIAVDLPTDLRSQLGSLAMDLDRRSPGRAVRWVRPEGIHLTLKFLGDIPEKDLAAIRDFLARTVRGFNAFRVHVTGLGCFPNTRRPRVVWVGLEDPSGSLGQLQGAIESGLEKLGYPREGRPFSPHLTLGRLRQEAGEAAGVVGAAVENAPSPELGDIPVQAVFLFRSDLRPEGAVYTVLGEFPLEGRA